MDLLQTYRGRRVIVTGHTGFQGGWLSLWLNELGAKVTGLALAPRARPNLFDALFFAENLVKQLLENTIGVPQR